MGRRDALTENLNGTTTSSSYAYDNLSRLTQETLGANTQTFTYDSFGNRVTHNKFDSSVDYYEHDAAHQLKIVRENNAGGVIKARHQYAPNGDLIRVCEGASAPTVTTDELIRGECDLRDYRFYEYDKYGKMLKSGSYTNSAPITHRVFEEPVASPDLEQTNIEYKYDYAARRMGVSGFKRSGIGDNGSGVFVWTETNKDPHNTQYRYNGEAIYLSYKTGNTITNPNARWLQGAGMDEPLIRYGSDGTVTNYHQNGRNSAVLTTSVNSGAVVASQQFDAFGNQQASSGSIKQYGYTGREPDGSGLMYYRARYYDPQRGRFTQRDPKGMIDGINQYAYVRNNPVNRIDPNGTVSIGTNNYSSANNNYFSSGGSTSQSLFNTNSGFDAGATADLTRSVGGDTSFLTQLGASLPSLPQGIVDFAAGFGDSASFGATDKIRNLLNINNSVNKSSQSYSSGKISGAITIAGTGSGLILSSARGSTVAASALGAQSVISSFVDGKTLTTIQDAATFILTSVVGSTPSGKVAGAIINFQGTTSSALIDE